MNSKPDLKIEAKYPGAMPTPPRSGEVRINDGAMTINGIPMVWADGAPVIAGDIPPGAHLEVNVETGEVRRIGDGEDA